MIIMKCGCVPQAKTSDNRPVCVIHNCFETIEIDETKLVDRKAKCNYCGKITDSNYTLPYFKYCPEKEYDEYYDGCFGWS